MRATINQTLFSNFGIEDKNRKPYAKRGDEVTIIFESLPAMIVENKKGERFAININKLTIKTE